jgi:type I restriction enzyme M protein
LIQPNLNQPIVHDIVAKLWNLCNILKDDGVTYHQYVIELTYLLFLKMAKETRTESQLPAGYRWDDLKAQPEPDRLPFYNSLLNHLGCNGSYLVREIFGDARSSVKKPPTLSALVTEIDKLEWYSVHQEGLGDIYEGLLQKNASEKKSGAGQYFTPRPLVESMVSVMKPTVDDVIQDPAAGTGGFLIAANRYLCEHTDPTAWTQAQKRKYRDNTFYGMEHVHDTYHLALMNLMLHGLESDPNSAGIHYDDTLSDAGAALPKATLILSNPPFGAKKGGGLPTRKDFPFPTTNKQLCFLQHIYLGLQPGGRAAVVMPDNVLFESSLGKQVRVELMEKCNLHTILRLPGGIFYAQGVNANVLYFTRGKRDEGNTQSVWVYDLRTNIPTFGTRTQLTRDHFAEFEAAFGDDPLGRPESLAKRTDTGESGRFRCFSRSWIAKRGDSLDISWLKDDNGYGADDLPEPATLVQQMIGELEGTIEELRGILIELGEEVEE